MRRAPLVPVLALSFGCSATDAGLRPRPEESSASALPGERGAVCSSAAHDGGVSHVVIRGATDGRSACAVLRTIAGSAYDEGLGDVDIHALFATGAFEDVVLLREAWAGRESLVFEVTERPILTGMDVRGAKSPEALEAVRGLSPAPRRVDPAWIHASVRALTEALDAEGYRAAKVSFKVEDGNVIFIIDEGPRTLLTSVRFDGLRLAKAPTLRDELRLTPGEPFFDDLLERDRLFVEWGLFRQGFLDAKVTSHTFIDPNDHAATVTFRVTEGRRYRLGSVVLAGDISEALRASIEKRLAVGKPVDITAASDAVTDIEAELRKAGRPGKVERALVPDKKAGVAAIEIRVVNE